MILYIITVIMLSVVGLFILLVVKIMELKRYMDKKNEFYMNRIDGIEAIVRTEFKAIVDEFKKIINGRRNQP